MNTEERGLVDGQLTERVIGVFYSVHRELGHGFVESVYENAFAHALRAAGLYTEQQVPLVVRFHGVVVGEFRADIVVERRLLLELKSVAQLAFAHEAQLINYLKATGLRVGLLLNFGPRAQFRRRIFDPSKISANFRVNPRQSASKKSSMDASE